MAEEKKEPWLNYLALTTVVFAVCATLSTLKAGSFSTRSVMAQTQAADQWAFYQAKSIKGYLYELQRDELVLEMGGLREPLRTAYAQKVEGYTKKIKTYDAEKAEIMQKARELESRRDIFQRHAGAFGMAAMFLQIGILLSSIAALMKQRYFWYLGMAVGAVGLVYFSNGFWLFM